MTAYVDKETLKRQVQSQSKNVQVQYVYHGCQFLSFDQTSMAQKQKKCCFVTFRKNPNQSN